MLAGHEQFGPQLLDFGYILFDINRYQEEDLIALSRLVSDVFMLDREIKEDSEIIDRLCKLSGGLSCRSGDEFQQLLNWLKHVIKPRIDEKLHEQIDSILNEANPKEVVAMISNIEIALAESHRRAQLEGEAIGLDKGKLDDLIKRHQ